MEVLRESGDVLSSLRLRCINILGFLLILLSTTIYTAPHALPNTPNLPLQHLTHSLERRLVLSLLCSLLNTSLASTKPSSAIGGVASMPYNHLISNAAEERRTLVRDCLMTLLVALDYQAPKGPEDSLSMPGSGEKEDNAFKYFISKLVSWLLCEVFPANGPAQERRLFFHSWRDHRYSRRTHGRAERLLTRKQKACAIYPGDM